MLTESRRLQKRYFQIIVISSIVLCTVGIAAYNTIIYYAGSNPDSKYSAGAGGLIEKRCIDGYKFLVTTENGHTTQVLDKQGKGVPCSENK